MIPIHLTGYISEQKIALYYSKLGYVIYWPNHTQSSCDFIACKDDELIRVQVKSAYWMGRSTGKSYLQTTVRKGCNGNSSYTKKECDVIAISFEDRIWLIPIEELGLDQTVVLDRKQFLRTSYKKDWSVFEIKPKAVDERSEGCEY